MHSNWNNDFALFVFNIMLEGFCKELKYLQRKIAFLISKKYHKRNLIVYFF